MFRKLLVVIGFLSALPLAAQQTQLANPTITNSFASVATYEVANVLDGNTATDYASNNGGTSTFIDFDFGSSVLITRVDFTDRTSSGGANGSNSNGPEDNVSSFDLIFSDDPTFTTGNTTVSVSSAPCCDTVQTLINAGAGITARYVRYDVTGITGSSTNNGAAEFAFFTDNTPPSVTIDQAGAQADPTSTSPISFTVVFSEPVFNFVDGDVTLSGTAGATTAVVSGGPTTYNVDVSGMTTCGTVIATINAGVANDAAGNQNLASTSTDNTVTFTDATQPSVTIDQAGSQSDPGGSSPINFTVIFSEAVTGFTGSDVTLGGTANPTTANVTGSGTTYNVAVSGMSQPGSVTASINAGVASDSCANTNLASTSRDNSVTFAPGAGAGPVTPVPAVSGWMLLLMASLLAAFGVVRSRF